jgi:hypothetical protein
VAFRAITDAFVDYNLDVAKAQCAREGVTLDEKRELTFFAESMRRSQQWRDVERMLGESMPEEKKKLAEALMFSTSQDIKAQIREHVAKKDDIAERWKSIHAVEERYQTEYFALTDMNAELFDKLLAGDEDRPYAPIAVSPDPRHLPQAPGEPPPPQGRTPPAPE